MIQGSGVATEEERSNTIATFRAVTAINDDNEARRILESCSWDLDQAVTLFLDNPSVAQASTSSQNSSQQHEQRSSSDSPRDPNPSSAPQQIRPAQMPQSTRTEQEQVSTTPSSNRVPRWMFAVFSPFRFVWSFLSNLTSKLMHLLSGPAYLIDSAPGNTPARRFLSFYESRYGTNHPDFFDGSYMSALAAASSQLKFMLVYIHSESHRLTPSFCRNVLGNDAFISAANESFVTWAGSITQRDAAAAHHALRAPALPFMAIVAAPSQQNSTDLLRAHFGTLLSVRAGPTLVSGGAQSAVSWVARVLQRHSQILETIRAQRVERESARILRQQQDEEFAASLEADRQKEREAEEQRAREESERKRVENFQIRRARKKEALGEEPEKGPGIATVVLRLPDGTRVGRRFEQGDVVEKVFDWAEVNGVDIEVACLVISYPRRTLRYPEDANLTVRDAGLFPSCMLLLEERGE